MHELKMMTMVVVFVEKGEDENNFLPTKQGPSIHLNWVSESIRISDNILFFSSPYFSYQIDR